MAAAKKRNPAMRVVVIDPRRTASCDLADLHLPISPGADGYLFVGLLAWLQQTEASCSEYIAQHTEGYREALEAANAISFAETARLVGLETDVLETFYQWFAETDKTITFYSQGINQSSSGTDKGNAIINCHLATGRVGKVGAGPFSITGQPNAMGGREVGGLANQLAAHMDYNPEDLRTVADFWATDQLCQQPGMKAVDLFDAVADGRIKAIWIMATNPVVSMPDADRVRGALQQCDTVIVSDCVAATDTTATADILLPATGWGGEKRHRHKPERRISRQRALIKPAGEAKDDWWIISQVAQRLGFSEAFSYRSPRDVFVEHAALSGFRNNGKRIFNISGLSELSEQQYNDLSPIQWPITAESPAGTTRLFSEGGFVTASGKARFIAIAPRLPVQSLNAAYPYALNTGRIRDQWHTMTRTARAQRLLNHLDAPFVLVHPETARTNELYDGDLAEVRTAYGAVRVGVMLDEGMGKNQALFMPIHWNDQFARQARVCSVIAPLTDPVSGQPEFKFTPRRTGKSGDTGLGNGGQQEPLECDEFIDWSMTPLTDNKGYCYRFAAA